MGKCLYVRVFSWNVLTQIDFSCLFNVGFSCTKSRNDKSNFGNFIKKYDKSSGKGYIVSKSLHDLHSDLSFLLERVRIKKCSKLLCNLFSEEKYVVHTITLKQALNRALVMKKA